jgi:hypothetical protein
MLQFELRVSVATWITLARQRMDPAAESATPIAAATIGARTAVAAATVAARAAVTAVTVAVRALFAAVTTTAASAAPAVEIVPLARVQAFIAA